MGLFEQWPYVNFHDLNLDWIIRKIKNVETAEANSQASAEASAESAAASQLSADASLASQEAAHQSELNASQSAENAADSEATAKNYADNIADPVSGIVTQWLADNITPTTPAVDSSLTIAGAAADASVTGDRFDNVDDDLFIMSHEKMVYDTSAVPAERKQITSGGNWAVTAGGNLISSSVIKTPISTKKITVKTGELSTEIAFLKSYDPTQTSGAADLSDTYHSVYTVPANTEKTYVFVDDIKYMYFERTTANGSDITPVIEFESTVINTNELYYRGNIVKYYQRFTQNQYGYANSAGVALSYGSSTAYSTLWLPAEPDTHYICDRLRYLTFIDENGISLSPSLQNVKEFTTTTDTKQIVAVFYNEDNTIDDLVISAGEYLEPESDLYEIPWLYDPNKQEYENIKDKTLGIIKPGINYSGDDQTFSFSEPNSIKRDKMAVLSCSFSSIGTVEVGLSSSGGSNKVSIIITSTTVAVKKNGVTGTPVNHGLTITDKINVVLAVTVDNKFKYEVSSGGETYTGETAFNTAYCKFYYAFENMTAENIDFSATCRDFDNNIWIYGDSYLSYGTNRWMYYLIENGYSENCLIDAYPGENTTTLLRSLTSYKDQGSPKYILWCGGMNDGSDGTTVNTTWMNNVNSMLSICNEKNITPIFGTIPTVPTINHEKKNEWIRNSGYQYIDFAKAVGAQPDGTWLTGMLSSDNVHPTPAGAKALYYQALADCPQLLQK